MEPSPPESIIRTTNGPRGIHPAIKRVWLFSGLLGSVFMAALLATPTVMFTLLVRKNPNYSFLMGWIIAAGILLWALSLVYTLAKIRRQWENWQYEVREHDVILSWGVFWQTRRHVARDRIQHLDINSGPLDRRFGLVQVGIYTAGAAGAVGTIPGLRPEEAEDLRDMILESQADHV